MPKKRSVDRTDRSIEETILIAFAIGIIALIAVISYIRAYPDTGSPYQAPTTSTINASPYTSSVPQTVTAPSTSSSSASTTVLPTNTVLLNVQLSNSYGQPVITPSVIRVKAWSNLVINVTNEGTSQHGLWVQLWSGAIGTPYLNPGQNYTLRFTVYQVGNFSYYSQVANDQKNGMVGTLVVTGG